jgi:hypothetical protein
LKPGAFQLWVRGSQRAPPHRDFVDGVLGRGADGEHRPRRSGTTCICESEGSKPSFHGIGARVERNQALASLGALNATCTGLETGISRYRRKGCWNQALASLAQLNAACTAPPGARRHLRAPRVLHQIERKPRLLRRLRELRELGLAPLFTSFCSGQNSNNCKTGLMTASMAHVNVTNLTPPGSECQPHRELRVGLALERDLLLPLGLPLRSGTSCV